MVTYLYTLIYKNKNICNLFEILSSSFPDPPRSNLTISIWLFCEATWSGVNPSILNLFTLIPSAPTSSLIISTWPFCDATWSAVAPDVAFDLLTSSNNNNNKNSNATNKEEDEDHNDVTSSDVFSAEVFATLISCACTPNMALKEMLFRLCDRILSKVLRALEEESHLNNVIRFQYLRCHRLFT